MLKDKTLPEVFNELPDGHVLRVWITGCSTGEEAYSFAIVFKEAYEKIKHRKNLTLQIFASDIDKDAIEIARKGIFSSNILADVSSERLSQFFSSKDNSYYVNTSIRELIIFAPHNVIKDPPFTKLDFLVCRNVLIYMEAELQKKLMNLFHYSLNKGGIMLLGSAENVNSQENLFNTIDAKLKLYKRSISPVEIEKMNFPSSFSHSNKQIKKDHIQGKTVMNIQTFADQLLLQRFAPASVLINTDGDILYITGRTGKYLEPAAGRANWNIYAMAREGLRNELSGAIRKAKQNYEPVHLKNIKIGNNGGTLYVNITFQSTEKPEEFKGTIMIVFTDVMQIPKPAKRKPNPLKHFNDIQDDEAQIELQRTLEELQSTREEMQTSQEELKSTNEELQSTNEELQSTNEELTTSKEEMQSLNEELQTLNLELQSKVAEFVEANNDMKNLLNSTDVATLFLDKELNIRRFTNQITKIIQLRPTDIGRPFIEMASDLQYPDIAEHAREVLHSLIFRESNISTNDQRWFTVRIMPYRTMDDKINGVVITFIDISASKKLEAKLIADNHEENERLSKELNLARKELNILNKEKNNLSEELKKANDILLEHNLLKS